MSTVATPASPSSQPKSAIKRYYFSVAFATLLALSLIAFGDNLVTDVTQPSNGDPKMIVHGLFSLAWVVLLTLQANLVRAGNLRLHRKLGTVAFVAGAGLALSTAYLFFAVWKGWAAMAPHIQANRILLASFALWIFLAYKNRHRPDLHKRLVYTGTIFLLEPVLARCFDPIVLPFLPSMPEARIEPIFLGYLVVTWSAFFLSLFAYDHVVSRRIHPVSWASYAWLLAVYAFVFLT